MVVAILTGEIGIDQLIVGPVWMADAEGAGEPGKASPGLRLDSMSRRAPLFG